MNFNQRIRTIYNPRGWVRPIAYSTALHVGRLWTNPAYRFLQKLHSLSRRVPRFVAGEVSFQGRRISYVDIASFASAWDEIFVNGIYDIGQPGGDEYFVDAGSNIGLATLYWASKYSNARGVALEPDPVIARVLRRNISEWGAQFSVEETAVAASEGIAEFNAEGADGGSLSHGDSANTIKVSLRRLSPFLDRPVSLLKIDIEGAEYEVVEEIRSSLKNVKRIFVECHASLTQPQRYGALIQLLQEEGFRCQLHSTRQYPSPFRLDQENIPSMDVSINVFGVKL
jgi:FkbM family methyltransferase